MVIIPLSGKVSWKNPPFVTIALIVVNCIVFFVFQSNDGEYQDKAYTYYFESGLARTEVSAYIVHKGLDRKDPELTTGRNGEVSLDNKGLFQYWREMTNDERFVYDLVHDKIITPSDQRYQLWKERRTKFDGQISKAVSDRYGFKPAEWSVLTAFTAMFLHGNFEHILGNMIFLWLVGCVLEMGCGRIVYLVMYFIGGLCASLLFGLVKPYSLQPCVGASGAIASLIGAYMVLYGMRKIKVLYSLGFYFNTAMVPAIAILPVWIGRELFEHFLSPSNVANMAHVGGLIGGSVMGFINLALVKKVDTKVFDEDPREKIPGLLEEAMQAMERLNPITARTRLEQILAIDPKYPGIINHLYNVEKLHPADAAYDEAANRLLEHLLKEKAKAPEILRVYKEYLSLAPRPKIGMDLLFRICSAFLAGGGMEEGEKIINMVLKKNPEAKQLPRMLLFLARTYLKQGDKDKALRAIGLISERFPSSHESEAAKNLLQDIHLRREMA